MSPASPSRNRISPVPAARHRHLRHLLELALLEAGEDLRVREETGGLLGRGHGRIISGGDPDAMAVAPDHIGERQLHEAAEAIAGTVRETPVLPAGELSRRLGARVTLKAENLQVTGSFKARGATNAIRQLSDAELAAGVVAASAGNHAQAVAFAARSAGSHALLVMPERASLAKVAAVRQYGGEVTLRGRRLRRGAVGGGTAGRGARDARGPRVRLSGGRGRAGDGGARDRAPGAGHARGRGSARWRRPGRRHRSGHCRGAAGRARGGSAGRGVRSVHRLARGAPADRRALGQHDLRRDRGQAARGTTRSRSWSATWTRS